ncbi:MAG TPA: GNAT family N-acetyltransferase [Cellvibrionaceae bacterium]|nr:GNAT family N-acetyltransferase [Cellvibrionaceae bacterium]HMW72594.1 GNAT family N-acetyltransferase [Cellvibrionaceae bacterium]HMY41310.1 GNAT family N-acetyltransferase [Marinagarivorans sp.]HNG62048.1 GNAT family N-acetyltransferase [Cellvibrionaceae bacterium]
MLRPAEPKDATAIGTIRVAAWQAAYSHFLPEDFLTGLDPNANLDFLRTQLAQQSDDFRVWVAEADPIVVGFCIIGKPRYQAGPSSLEIWAINVSPYYWRKGIGQQLLTQVINYYKHQYAQLTLWCIKGNLPAQRCYEQLGFMPSGQARSTTHLTGHPLHEIEYIKTL